MERLVGQLGDVGQAIQMADAGMQVHRFYGVAAGATDDVIALGEFDQVAEVLLVASTASTLHVGAVGRAGDLGKGQILAADADVALRVARMQGEFAGAGPNSLHDQVAVKAHALDTVLHIGTGLFQNGACLHMHEVNAHLFQYRQRGVVDRFQLVLGDHGRRREAVLERPVFGGGERGTNGAATAATASAGTGGATSDFF